MSANEEPLQTKATTDNLISTVNKSGHHRKRTLAQKINLLRASVMGANDGIISVAGIVIGVAGATSNLYSIFIAGISGLLAGNISMAMGEYVSVHSQKDAQQKAIAREKRLLAHDYNQEFQMLCDRLTDSGISPRLARKAAEDMLKKDPIEAVVREKYGFELHDLSSPIGAAATSMISFTIGALIPLVAMTFLNPRLRIAGTLLSVVAALVVTGWSAAALGQANKSRGMLRNVVSGLMTMLVTYCIGRMFA